MGEGDNKLWHQLIHPDIEPAVIDNDLLAKCVLEYGPKEEAGRLFAEEGVHLDEAFTVRIEFKNIIRIDHLWMLTSLRRLSLAHNLIETIECLDQLVNLNELDLSFNKITKIENLDNLENLEVLSLFHNQISKLENMENLKKLMIFSIGYNLLEDYREISYLRQFRFLRSVSIKGNPCCETPKAYNFFKSALVKVTYLDYHLITDEEREACGASFRITFTQLCQTNILDKSKSYEDLHVPVGHQALRQLDEADELAEKKRLAQEAYDAKVAFYAMSFVEYMNGPELVEKMFEEDTEGTILFKAGGDMIKYYESYKDQYVEVMDPLVEFAQEAYNDRQNEIKLYREMIDTAMELSVEGSKEVIVEYESKKKPMIQELNELVELYNAKKATAEEVEQTVADLSEKFNDILHETWKGLMKCEMELFERCEESRAQFSTNMTEKVNKLLEVSRNSFGAWRSIDGAFISKTLDYLSPLLGIKERFVDSPPELMAAMMDRDMMMDLIAQSADNRARFIDNREDVLVSRSSKWRDELVRATNEDEVKRNRNRVYEINFFIDNQRRDWTDLQMNFTEAIDPETAALLGEDF